MTPDGPQPAPAFADGPKPNDAASDSPSVSTVYGGVLYPPPDERFATPGSHAGPALPHPATSADGGADGTPPRRRYGEVQDPLRTSLQHGHQGLDTQLASTEVESRSWRLGPWAGAQRASSAMAEAEAEMEADAEPLAGPADWLLEAGPQGDSAARRSRRRHLSAEGFLHQYDTALEVRRQEQAARPKRKPSTRKRTSKADAAGAADAAISDPAAAAAGPEAVAAEGSEGSGMAEALPESSLFAVGQPSSGAVPAAAGDGAEMPDSAALDRGPAVDGVASEPASSTAVAAEPAEPAGADGTGSSRGRRGSGGGASSSGGGGGTTRGQRSSSGSRQRSHGGRHKRPVLTYKQYERALAGERLDGEDALAALAGAADGFEDADEELGANAGVAFHDEGELMTPAEKRAYWEAVCDPAAPPRSRLDRRGRPMLYCVRQPDPYGPAEVYEFPDLGLGPMDEATWEVMGRLEEEAEWARILSGEGGSDGEGDGNGNGGGLSRRRPQPLVVLEKGTGLSFNLCALGRQPGGWYSYEVALGHNYSHDPGVTLHPLTLRCEGRVATNARHLGDLIGFLADPTREAVLSHATNVALLRTGPDYAEWLSPAYCHWSLLRRWGAVGLAHVRWGPGDTLAAVLAARRNPTFALSRVKPPTWEARVALAGVRREAAAYQEVRHEEEDMHRYEEEPEAGVAGGEAHGRSGSGWASSRGPAQQQQRRVPVAGRR